MIKLDNVCFSYGSGAKKTDVLRSVSLEINKGEAIAIVGPSGSGKSTLLNVMACFLQPSSGRIIIDDIDVSSLNNFELAYLRNRKLGFVFQQFHLLAKTTVLENIILPTLYPTELPRIPNAKARAEKLAAHLGLTHLLNNRPNQLSGGEQQRTAIARALINDADIIFADEPTGNLDSRNAANVIDIIKDLSRQGKTVVVITHDQQIAAQFDKIYHIHDGVIADQMRTSSTPTKKSISPPVPSLLRSIARTLPMSFSNMWRHKMRSFLTMLGICIGVAAVLATTTLGRFTKEKMLASYAELGINTINFSGYPSFRLTATDEVTTMFKQFDPLKDLQPLKRIFPNIKRIAPQTQPTWGNTVTYGGKATAPNVLATGVSEHTFHVMNWPLAKGHNFLAHHLLARSAVCIIGSDVERDLFRNIAPVGKIIHVSDQQSSFVCKVIGVLTPRTSNNPWDTTPNLKIFIPYTFFMGLPGHFWTGINNMLIEVKEGSGVEKTGNALKAYFTKKYGKSGEFVVGFDATLMEQMNRFLTIFSLVLTIIALISLSVGGIGIANMMLVSLAERYKEIGLKKAIGATDASIRMQFLQESLILCFVAGCIGLTLGFFGYEGAIYGASRLAPKVEFVWIVDNYALMLSFISIVVVGFLSGIVPAIKAERLAIAESMRAE